MASYWGFDAIGDLSILEPVLLFPFLVLLCYFFLIEVTQMFKPKTYFTTSSNYVDLVSYLLNFAIISYRTYGSDNYQGSDVEVNMSTLRIMGALAGLFLWF